MARRKDRCPLLSFAHRADPRWGAVSRPFPPARPQVSSWAYAFRRDVGDLRSAQGARSGDRAPARGGETLPQPAFTSAAL